MEMKNYQKKVIADLKDFLRLLRTNENAEAYRQLWGNKGVDVFSHSVLGNWHAPIQSVPMVCLKVPTGGGKTFIACNAIKPIFDELGSRKIKTVVWLVPSDAILQQTVKSLTNSKHPYRQQLDVDFGSRVCVLTKEESLGGQNFNISTVYNQLTILVLSYDSFRAKSKDQRRSYQENSNLTQLSEHLGPAGFTVKDADESALIQVINKMNPLVIVDESHHATTSLSIEMLRNFNPSFVLELTATPKETSNIISIVDATQLKKENMVKLPVILYNRLRVDDVVVNAIDLRDRLEELANDPETPYLRPIVLIQAQPKTNNDSETFEKVKANLMKVGIKESEIAIKTAEKDDLKGKDLLKPDCPIRYIITINALKEGWDCPFAYILASLANRSSKVEVEQLVGRVLRQPYAERMPHPAHNMAYVLTSSQNFSDTIQNIEIGLKRAGFSKENYRFKNDVEETKAKDGFTTTQQEKQETEIELIDDIQLEEETTFNPEAVSARLNSNSKNQNDESLPSKEQMTEEIIKAAEEEQEKQDIENAADDFDLSGDDIPSGIRNEMLKLSVRKEFQSDIENIVLPQFLIQISNSFDFIDHKEDWVELKPEHLLDDFSLKKIDSNIDITAKMQEIAQIDADEDSGISYRRLTIETKNDRALLDFIETKEPRDVLEMKFKRECLVQLAADKTLNDREIDWFINSIFDKLTIAQKDTVRSEPKTFALALKNKIEEEKSKFAWAQFREKLETGEIKCAPLYRFRKQIDLEIKASVSPNKSLYIGEQKGNQFEQKFVYDLTGLNNIRWWHRNLSRKGFYINGPVGHYPDFIICTKAGTILIVETKGDHLIDSKETLKKLELGEKWEKLAGTEKFKYFMVNQYVETTNQDIYKYEDFIHLLKKIP